MPGKRAIHLTTKGDQGYVEEGCKKCLFSIPVAESRYMYTEKKCLQN